MEMRSEQPCMAIPLWQVSESTPHPRKGWGPRAASREGCGEPGSWSCLSALPPAALGMGIRGPLQPASRVWFRELATGPSFPCCIPYESLLNL